MELALLAHCYFAIIVFVMMEYQLCRSERPHTQDFSYGSWDMDITSDDATPRSVPDLPEKAQERKLTLLSLPLEIRLHIYHWLHLMSPVRHAQLAPWYPTPVHCQYILRPLDHILRPLDHEAEPDGEAKGLLSPYRPLSGLPTSLLRANSQIYHEARLIPFSQNEFVFVNWFASGLWAARAFTRALAPWQRGALRYVRLEVLARDVVVGGAGREEWRALCGEWASGVRGLRMKMVLGSSTATVSGPSVGGGMGPRSEAARRWVGEGLGLMRKLERVEMEVVSRGMSDEAKMLWCEKLERELREGGLKWAVVVCAEKVHERMEWIKSDVAWKNQGGS